MDDKGVLDPNGEEGVVNINPFERNNPNAIMACALRNTEFSELETDPGASAAKKLFCEFVKQYPLGNAVCKLKKGADYYKRGGVVLPPLSECSKNPGYKNPNVYPEPEQKPSAELLNVPKFGFPEVVESIVERDRYDRRPSKEDLKSVLSNPILSPARKPNLTTSPANERMDSLFSKPISADHQF